MSLYQIVYSSRSCISGTPEEVEAEVASILLKSRENNQHDDITGALLFNGKSFAQVLEGPASKVEEIYERIQCDPRHDDVVLLSNTKCDQRSFSDWSMAYVDSSSASTSRQTIDLDSICSDHGSGGPRLVEALHQLLTSQE